MSSQEQSKAPSFFQRFFFLKTTFAKLLLLIIIVGGWLSASNMVKESQPDLEIASATVTTTWAGGDAQSIEQTVTNKLEKELKTLKGLKTIQSGSFTGYSVINVEFKSNVDAKDAMTRLRGKVSAAEGDLPKAADKPKVVQASVSDKPIFSIRLHGDKPLSELTSLAKTIKHQFERVSGVNKTEITGDRDDIVMVRLIGSRLNALGISPVDVRNALQAANLDMPWGRFDGEQIGATFRIAGRFRSVEQLQNLPIKRFEQNRVVLLKEVAEVKRTAAEERTRTFFSSGGKDFTRAVGVSITKQPGTDAIEIIDNTKQVLDDLKASPEWPKGVDASIVVDESTNIHRDLMNVFNNGWQSVIAVFVVLLISLTWREALIAGLAIPISFAGGLIIIAGFGYSLNQIVIIGMVIALGLLVDVFIMMMEGMHDNMFVKGKNFGQSALATVKTYGIPALTGQLTTILAMAPLLGISGMVGKFIRSMPMTAIACLIASYIVALLLCVPLSKYLLPKAGTKLQKTKVDKITETYSDKLANLLEKRFLSSKKVALTWIGIAVTAFVASLMALSTLPSEMMPKADGRNMGILVEMAPTTSLLEAQQCATAVGDKLRQQPYFESVTENVGQKSQFSMTSPSDQLLPSKSLGFVGFTTIFVPKSDREKLAYQYVPEISKAIDSAIDSCPGGKVLITPELGGAGSESPVQIQIEGDDMAQLRTIANQVIDDLKSIKGATNVRHNLGLPNIEFKATPKMEALNFYGISLEDLANQTRLLMTSDKVGKFVLGGIKEDIDIFMGYSWPSRNGEIGGPTSLYETNLLNITLPDGRSVPLSELINIELRESATAILHKDSKRTVTVLADTDNRTASEINADLEPMLQKQMKSWPQGYKFRFGGEAESSKEVFGSAGVMLVLALFLVFALLVLQFDSFKQPGIVMAAIPLALTGTFFGFYLLSMPFSFMAMVGIIALIGIVVNNSIVMIDTMNTYRKNGMSALEASARGAADRLRPILTTSLTTVAGMVTLAIGQKMWLPLSWAIISGLTLSTILALFIVPCLYFVIPSDTSEEEAV
ncbi:efflux RND transporter permease subunit [Parashewanella tropica]|uniref:efflux RND transporter permease subunit n=1 Tax=Parashewanella tropica TaxID=2547970 RepID=UPI00105A2A6F|nr:efflux RND transporter permease subunit [Parashewanella tropica]